VGLLEKSLKKAGKERDKSPKADEKRSVAWLRTSLGERTSALADKIDLEEQYARLESLAGNVPEPPKPSLRDRARRILGKLNPAHQPAHGDAAAEQVAAAERPRMTLRQKAALLVKRVSGQGGSQSGAMESGNNAAGGASGAPDRRDTQLAPAQSSEQELPPPVFFPWLALSEDGTLHSQISFGDEGIPLTPGLEETQPPGRPNEVGQSKAPLAEFADTIERITENLKNLHVQLDKTNFIRDVHVEERRIGAETRDIPKAIISNHVPLDSGMAPGEAEFRGQQGTQQAPQPKDVFWPRNLPLELPARDIRINADGSVSVVPGPFQLPYLSDDIAPPNSQLSHFTRSLKNAELFIAEGELQLTRIIYERLLKQIIDAEARRKIRANLEALDKYRKGHEWGNFMPILPWMPGLSRDLSPPQVSVNEMPVEAKSITINIDKGFFDVVRAAFEQQKVVAADTEASEETAKGEEGAGGAAAESAEGEETAKGEEGAGAVAAENATSEEATDASQVERRSGSDRRQGLPDTRGAGAPERRSGKDRRAVTSEENATPQPFSADGASAETPDEAVAEAEKPAGEGVLEQPQIPQMAPDGTAQAGGVAEDGGAGEDKAKEEEENKVQEIRGVLELKTPDQEDTPFLTLTYDFTKIPHAYRLAKDNGIFEYAYYKYKPMLVKAHQFIKRKQITRALNYYRVIREQQIPSEFRHMVDRNIKDITEYLQKYLVTRQN